MTSEKVMLTPPVPEVFPGLLSEFVKKIAWRTRVQIKREYQGVCRGIMEISQTFRIRPCLPGNRQTYRAIGPHITTWLSAMWVVVFAMLHGCNAFKDTRGADPLVGPYENRQVWAVAPLRNESGTLSANPYRLADQIAAHLESAANIDVLPVNRVLVAMESLGLQEITSKADATALVGALNVDGLVVGSIANYEPYDPPKLSLAIDLYTSPHYERQVTGGIRRLSWAATGNTAQELPMDHRKQPVSTISAHLDAGNPNVRELIKRYARDRGSYGLEEDWHLYRISMERYSEFATYVMCWRLLNAEARRGGLVIVQTPPAWSASRIASTIFSPNTYVSP